MASRRHGGVYLLAECSHMRTDALFSEKPPPPYFELVLLDRRMQEEKTKQQKLAAVRCHTFICVTIV